MVAHLLLNHSIRPPHRGAERHIIIIIIIIIIISNDQVVALAIEASPIRP